MASTISNNSKLSEAYNIVNKYLQSINNTEALSVLSQYKNKIYQQNLGGSNTLGLFNGSQIFIDDNVTDSTSMAGVLIHELTHALDQKKDFAAGQRSDNSIQEEVSAFMATEDLMDSLGKGQYSQTGTSLRSLLTPEIEQLYASQHLSDRSYGDETIGTTPSIGATESTVSTTIPSDTTGSTSTTSDTTVTSGSDSTTSTRNAHHSRWRSGKKIGFWKKLMEHFKKLRNHPLTHIKLCKTFIY